MSEAVINIETFEDYHHIAMEGRWLQIDERALMRQLVVEKLQEKELDFIVDMSRLSALNSEGINDLIRSIALAKQKGKAMVFIRVPHKIIQLLKIVQINSIITICDTLEDAQELLNNRHHTS